MASTLSERVKLFCLAHAGGTASTAYAALGDLLADVAEVIPLDVPGRGEAPSRAVRSVDDLVSFFGESILDNVDGPWCVLGHSFGAALALQVARTTERLGRGPACCFVSGRRPSGTGRTRVPRARPRSDEELLEQVASWGGVPPEFLANPGLRRMAANRLRRDIEFSDQLHELRDQAPVAAALHVLTGRSDPLARPDEARGWVEHSTGRVTFDEFDGGHFFISTNDLVAPTIATYLTTYSTTSGVPA
ncbi:thioesterase II family protein [Nocardiopsis halotolerans]|uniref:thioesterase II family protein n=1 Tax=Nocardiopsis halotolerans TaxID=124252 RepID=UPI00037B61F4|nr:alpha/beta fold hydrolase [Nocardiopsis halotolerans]